MSLEKIKKQIEQFIRSETSGVLSIRGKWGVGKTYLWNETLRKADFKKTLFPNYAYISLFGINSIDDLKIDIALKNMSACPESKRYKGQAALLPAVKALATGASIPFIDATTVVKTVGFQFVKNTIVCFDDLERKGQDLNIKEIMGLASVLKENQNCKVVFIFNDESFAESFLEEYKILDQFREKVIDREIKFEIPIEEAIQIGVQDKNLKQTLGKCIKELKIDNIRIIKRIEQHSLEISEVLTPLKLNPLVLEKAVRSLALYCRSFYSKEKPDFKELKNYNEESYYSSVNHPDSINWQDDIKQYGFINDGLDKTIGHSIETGILDASEIKNQSMLYNERLKLASLEDEFKSIWSLYHDNFDNVEDELVQKFVDFFKKGSKCVSPLNLNGTARLLRDLGYNEEASQIIDTYIEQRKNERHLFDPDSIISIEGPEDSELVEKFKKQRESSALKKSLEETVNKIVTYNARNPDDEIVLNSATADDYYNLFKKTKGEKLRKVVKTVQGVHFKETESYTRLSIIEIALKRIAAENNLNRIRVRKKFNLEIDNNRFLPPVRKAAS